MLRHRATPVASLHLHRPPAPHILAQSSHRRPGVTPAVIVPRRSPKGFVHVAASAAVEELYSSDMDTRIPVTVITGFLGSGKTTLLNNILTQDHGKRIAIIENEFGEIDIDSALVAQKQDVKGTGDTIMMLNNGCLCCTVRDDLVKSLNALYERRNEFDHILIETTGLANVSPIISTFYLTDQLPERVRLDGVVTMVDAKHIERHMNGTSVEKDANEAIEQIAYADRILLNKTDLVNEDALQDLEARVRKINGMATLSRSTYASVSVDYVLGIGGFDVSRVDEHLAAPQEEEHDHDHHHHEHEHHHHEDGVTSVSIVIEGDVDLEKVNTVLGAIVDMRGEDIYRMKGILAIKGWKERFVFQGVHMLFEGVPDRLWRSDEKRESKMVFIGKHLDKNDFEEAMNSCRA